MEENATAQAHAEEGDFDSANPTDLAEGVSRESSEEVGISVGRFGRLNLLPLARLRGGDFFISRTLREGSEHKGLRRKLKLLGSRWFFGGGYVVSIAAVIAASQIYGVTLSPLLSMILSLLTGGAVGHMLVRIHGAEGILKKEVSKGVLQTVPDDIDDLLERRALTLEELEEIIALRLSLREIERKRGDAFTKMSEYRSLGGRSSSIRRTENEIEELKERKEQLITRFQEITESADARTEPVA